MYHQMQQRVLLQHTTKHGMVQYGVQLQLGENHNEHVTLTVMQITLGMDQVV